jgi:hypothetical protein
MESKRRSEKNKIINEIKSTEILLTRSTETIDRLKYSTLSTDFVKTQISTLKNLIEDKTKHLEFLKDEAIKIEYGLKDNDINKEYEEEKIKNDRLSNEKNIQKLNKKKEKDSDKELGKNYRQKIISESRDYRQFQKEMSYSLKYFNKVCNEIPDYMAKNLSEMPNNKGYIWRGVQFYGDLPKQHGPTILFEKQKNILVIHEYTSTEYKKFEKEGKDKKILVYSEKLTPKPIDINLIDYCKTSLPSYNKHDSTPIRLIKKYI